MAKSKEGKTLAMKITMSFVTIVVLTLAYQGLRLRQVSQQLDGQLKNTQKEVEVESKKLKDLQRQHKEIDSLENVEKVAREKLGLIKNDEIIFKIP